MNENTFEKGLALWVKLYLDLDYIPEITGTDYTDKEETRWSSYTYDYTPATFDIFYADEFDGAHACSVVIQDYGFGRLVKEVAELMP